MTIKFAWGTDLDAVASDVRDRLDRVMGRLPDDIDRPVLWKYDSSSDPILFMGVTSNLDPVQLRQIIEDQVRYRIERVPGVASLDIWGGVTREIHVDVNAAKIKALSLPLDQILQTDQGPEHQPAGRARSTGASSRSRSARRASSATSRRSPTPSSRRAMACRSC